MAKNFEQLKEVDVKEFKNLMIIDTLNFCFRFKHANKKQFSDEFVRTVASLASSYQAKKVVLLGDGGSTYRKAKYPDYKISRVELREQQTPEEAQDFKEFIAEVDKSLELLNHNYLSLKFIGVEADDIAAYIVKHYSDNFNHTWLISSDKDWDLLVKDNVSRFSYKSRKEITLDNWNEHYEYAQKDHISIKVLMGDPGDDVPGIEGVGVKRAYNLIKEYGTAFDIYDLIPIQSKYKYIQNLNEFKEQLLLNYELMDLLEYCEEAIGEKNINTIKEKINGYF